MGDSPLGRHQSLGEEEQIAQPADSGSDASCTPLCWSAIMGALASLSKDGRCRCGASGSLCEWDSASWRPRSVHRQGLELAANGWSRLVLSHWESSSTRPGAGMTFGVTVDQLMALSSAEPGSVSPRRRVAGFCPGPDARSGDDGLLRAGLEAARSTSTLHRGGQLG